MNKANGSYWGLGVHRTAHKYNKGYWCAQLRTGIDTESKCFSIKTYGSREAKRLALQERARMVDK